MDNEHINPNDIVDSTMPLQVAAGWILVGIPLAWGVWMTAVKLAAFF